MIQAQVPVTFHAAFDEQAALTPRSVSAICRGKSRHILTYDEVRLRSEVLAAGLQRVSASAVSSTEAGNGIRPFGPVLAIHVSRVHEDFVPLLLASSRVGLPFVLLSTDLPDRGLEKQRFDFIFEHLHPHLRIVSSEVAATESSMIAGSLVIANTAKTVLVQDLVQGQVVQNGSRGHVAPANLPVDFSSEVLCFMFTGGTKRTKVVQVTHAMILHERRRYRDLWQPKVLPPAILAHTSVYWGASALGQLSIALAFGGAAVWTEATEVTELRRCIADESITILGVVPDHLDLLAEDPERELPCIEVVFTWGERLPHRVAERWRGHPRAILRELLIATEYWLAFWADPLGDKSLCSVGGVAVLILKECGAEAEVGELGELMIAGPMVMAGYTESELSAECFHISPGGRRFYRTRDIVRRTRGGFVYKGRSDMMAKSKGKWVDMLNVEEKVSSLEGVQAAKILPDPAQEHFHAFVALEAGSAVGSVLGAVRVELPPRVQLWTVPEMPRHPVTRKVDATRLLKMLGVHHPSWPLEVRPGFRQEEAPLLLQARLGRKMQSQAAWALGAAGIVWTLSNADTLLVQSALAVAWLGTMAVATSHAESRKGPGIVLRFMPLWLASSLLTCPPALVHLARAAGDFSLVTYAWISLIYADDARHTHWFGRSVMRVVDEIPLWKCGSLGLLLLLQHSRGPCGVLSRALLVGTGGLGMIIATRRRRFFSWPLVFWFLGAGHQIGIDCNQYLYFSSWRNRIYGLLCKIFSACAGFMRMSPPAIKSHAVSPAMTAAPAVAENSAPAEIAKVVCAKCDEDITAIPWPARGEGSQVLCDKCGAAMAFAAEAKAASWLEEHMQSRPIPEASRYADIADGGDSGNSENDKENCQLEPEAKRQRKDDATSGGNNHNGHAEDPWNHDRQLFTEAWWWYNHTTDLVGLTEKEQLQVSKVICTSRYSEAAAAAANQELPMEARLLCAAVEEVEPLLKPVHMGSVVLGLDSLRIARLSNLIKGRLGKALTVPQIREAKTVSDLVAAVSKAEPETSAETAAHSADLSDHSREYAVWFSPGQYSPMGHWVLRAEEPLDRAAMLVATQKLVERHAALRTQIADPIRYMSHVYDAATLFTLFAPLMDAGPPPLPILRRCISRALTHVWPRVVCKSREDLYGGRFPDAVAPLAIVECTDGQTGFERELRNRRSNLVPPGAVTGYELICYLEDAWAFHRWHGRFVIMRCPSHLKGAADAPLVYVDPTSEEWGPLICPGNARWQHPPYGFPALFFIPLSSGNVMWLRLDRRDELRVCYRNAETTGESGSDCYHLAAFRSAPQRGRDVHKPVVLSFVGVCMTHAFADGNCYLPLVHDLLAFYDTARGRKAQQMPQLGVPFAELEKRLFDTFCLRPNPLRHSLRGSCLCRFEGKGYGHNVGLVQSTVDAIASAAVHYRVPFDVALLGLTLCAQARAEETDYLEFTLYAPMRDGVSDSMSVGLFSDWRDISVTFDLEFSTILGTLLQVSHKVQTRQWTPFNALRKSERTIINIQPLDFQQRAGFTNLGENMWRDGDQLGRPEKRNAQMEWAKQPATFVIEQQDEGTWWILVSAADDLRPTPWMRRFAVGFREALRAFLFEPLTLVHRPLPDDATLLREFAEAAGAYRR